MPNALHATDIWWPGLRRATARSGVNNPVGKQLGIIDGVIITGIQAALPVWQTTPNPVLMRETDISPAKITLKERRLMAAIRLRRLDQQHPLRTRAFETTEKAHFRLGLRTSHRERRGITMRHDSRIQRANRLLPESEQPQLIPEPIPPVPRPPTIDKKRANREIKEWLSKLSHYHLCVYADGSGSEGKRTAWSYAAFKGGGTNSPILSDSGILSGTQIYDAEIHGAMADLEAVSHNLTGLRLRTIYVMLDNSATVQALRSGKSNPSSWRVKKFRELVEQATTRIIVKWIPGHTSIPDNELADQEARSALRAYRPIIDAPNNIQEPLTLTAIKYQARAYARQMTNEWWEMACPRRYADLELEMRHKKPPELTLAREVYARLIAARTAHGDFATYHRRWNHETALIYCSCGREKSVGHLVQCRKALANWRSVSGKRQPPALSLLPGRKG